MQDLVAGLFALIFVVSFFGGIVGLIAPSVVRFGRAERPSRKRVAGISALAVIASFIGFAVTVPEPTPQQKAEQEKQAARVKADQQTEAKAKTEAVHSEVVRLWAKVGAVGAGCDEAWKEAGASLQGGERYKAYEVAAQGQEACRIAHYEVRDLEAPPAVEDEKKEGIEKALDTCADAYLSKQLGLGELLKVIDGDARPSAITAVKQRAEASQMLTMQCAAQYLSAGHAIGVPLERIAKAETRTEAK